MWGLHWIGTERHLTHTKPEPSPDVPSLTALTRLTQSTDMLCSEPHVCPESPNGTTTPRRQRKKAIATTVSTPTEPPRKPRKSPAKAHALSRLPAYLGLRPPIPHTPYPYTYIPMPTISTRRVGVLDPSPSNISNISREFPRCPMLSSKILPIYRRKYTR